MDPQFKIKLHRKKSVYYTGEIITGKIHILNKPENLKIFGCVVLVECQHSNLIDRITDKRIELNSFEFSLPIPSYYFSSCISDLGRHAYFLKAIFSYPRGDDFTTSTVIKDIIIIRPLDLQFFAEIYKNIWSIGENSHIIFEFEHTAYSPDEPMEFKIIFLKKMRLRKITVSIWQNTKMECNPFEKGSKEIIHEKMIDSVVLQTKTCKRGDSFIGILNLPRGIALSTKYPCFSKTISRHFNVVNIEYYIKIHLNRKFWKDLTFTGQELLVGIKPIQSSGEKLAFEPEKKNPYKFVLQEDPFACQYAFIPKPRHGYENNKKQLRWVGID